MRFTRQRRPAPFRRPAPRPLRVSVVKYLNTAPLVWGLEHKPTPRYQLSYATPAACAEALGRGQADVGILPSIEYQSIPGLKIIPHLAIASERKVESVLLVSKGPARKARRVALDASSRTSAALVKILFAHHWKAEPEYAEAAPDLPRMLAEADAALLIGDPALQFLLRAPHAGASEIPNLHIYDLAEEWWRLTNLPFVFALWAVRGERVRTPHAAQVLARDFQRSRDEGLRHVTEIARAAAARLELPGGQLERYLLHSVQYRLDAPHRAGLESFFRFAHELGLIERVRPLEFL